MNNLPNLQYIPNYDTYVSKLISAVNKQDQNAINQILNKIDDELKKIRDKSKVTIEREKLQFIDTKLHHEGVRHEEALELEMEFNDNLGIFQLACVVKCKPVMQAKFAKMFQNLNDIRERTNIRDEFYNAESYSKGVQHEEAMYSKNEIDDLMKLYKIAQSTNFTEGVELIAKRLKKIAPNLVDKLIPKNSGTGRK